MGPKFSFRIKLLELIPNGVKMSVCVCVWGSVPLVFDVTYDMDGTQLIMANGWDPHWKQSPGGIFVFALSFGFWF